MDATGSTQSLQLNATHDSVYRFFAGPLDGLFRKSEHGCTSGIVTIALYFSSEIRFLILVNSHLCFRCGPQASSDAETLHK